MQKKKKIALAAALVLAAALGLARWLTLPSDSELVLYGNVDQRQVELAFIDAERVAEVLVQEGDEVREGQVLARLETRRLRDRIAVAEAQLASAQSNLLRLRNGSRPEEVDQARAAVASAEAELAFSQASHGRYSSLWRQTRGQAVSRQDVDQALLQLNVAKARLEEQRKGLRLAELGPRHEDVAEGEARALEAERGLEQLRRQLDDAELRSPAASVVNRRLLEPGDMASPARAVLSLAELDPKWVRAYVSEREMGRVRQGMRALVLADSHPGEPVEGRLGFISSVAEFTPKSVETAELRTSLVYEVRIYVRDEKNLLRLGMPVTVRFPDAGR